MPDCSLSLYRIKRAWHLINNFYFLINMAKSKDETVYLDETVLSVFSVFLIRTYFHVIFKSL